MIPTSLTSSSPPTACLGSIGNQMNNSPTISGSAKASNGAGGTVAATAAAASQGQGNNSAFLGIASLILEGRALADDEYAAIQTSRYELKTSFSSGNSAECGRQSPKPSTSRAAFGDNLSSGMSSNSFSIDLVNYLGRKASNSPESTSSSFLRDYYNSSSSESASSSVDSNHSRWSQKLSQLRQESPSAHHQAMPARQKVAIECPRGSDAEYVALAINTDHHHHQHHHQNHFGINEDRKGGDFEIIRRMSINQMNFYNSPNSMVGGGGSAGSGGGGGGSSENFMCSLQSLASNTCLRVGNPSLLATTSPPKYFNNRQISSSSTARCITPQQQQQQQQQLDYSNGSNSSSGSSGGVGGVSINTWYNSSSSHLSKNSSKSSGNNKDYLMRKSSSSSPQTLNTKTINSSTPNHNPHSNIFGRSNTSPATATTTTTTIQSSLSTATANRNQTYPQQGPHCDQFLKKMGLAKSDASDTEEHYCDMSYVNITCTRWRAYCIKMENILARGEPICIEVYLGPVGHKILLEQWIITQREKQPPPTMTLPSLCSAIRSQLYFSQISAWCDLIKKSDKTIHETGRVIYTTPATTSAAGDLATTTNNAMITASTTASTTSTHHPTAMSSLSTTSPTSVGGCSSGGVVVGVGCSKRRPSSPRLNIFYRIKQYDSTACFNSKPNVHNFPNVNISENCCVSVCLKSLPRITGGIPKVGITATQQQQQQQQVQQSQQNISTSGLSPTAMAASPPVNSATPSLAAKNKIAASDTSNAAHAAVAVNVAVDANAITTNANKLTILKMNCDNNLKEQQQQKPFTASSSSSCSISSSKRNSKQSLIEDNSDCNRGLEQDLQNVDFECYEERNIDMSAGGDNKVILCDSGMIDRAASIGDCDSSNSSLSTNNFGNLSHRERQLLKYRKRMLKRDKKQQLRKTNDNISANNQMQNNETESCNNNNNNNNNKMEQGEDDGDGDAEANAFAYDNDIDGNNSDTAQHSGERKYKVNNLENGQRKQLPNNHKNSIPCTNQLQLQQQHQYHSVKMISTGTQTITNTCTSCGSEKSMICLKCHPFKISSDDNNVTITTTTTTTTTTSATPRAGATTTVLDLSYNNEEIMDAETSSVSSLNASDIIHTPRNKAELLLQAIQRTPKSNKKHKYKQSKDSNQMAAIQQQKQKQQEQQQQQQLQNSPTTTNNISSNSPHNKTNSTHASGNNISHNNSNRNSSRSRSNSTSRSTSRSRSSVTNGVVVNNSSSSSNNSNNMMVGCQVCKRQKTQHNFNQSSNEELPSDDNNSVANSSLNSSCGSEISVAKISNQNKSSTDNDKAADDDNDDGDNEKEGGKNPTSDCVDNVSFPIDMGYENKVAEMPAGKSCDNFNESEIMEEEYFDSSTKLTPHIDRCSLNVRTSSYHAQAPTSRLAAATTDAAKIQYQSRACSDQLSLDDKKENSSVVEGTAMMAQFKTPTPSEQNENANKNKIQQPLQPHKHTPKPNLLHIACNFNSKTNEEQMSTTFIHNNIRNNNSNNNNNNNSNSNNNNNTPTTHNPLLLRRSLPKVNLTPIFCNPNSMMANVNSSPIPIGNGIGIGNGNANVCNGSLNGLTINSADATTAAEAPPTFSFESPSGSSAPSITVQKSNSAPTLPNSPSLSPRFVKASAIYKRRSRHLSERSDRSSLGSDEQFSDEDIDSGMYSPFASSPVKLKTRLAAVFGRNPLLGNLEECLLQRRLVPKIEVMGFKLLLGASGGFCPTQLTIPAAAYFYELKGETLSTPYLCEIRLPRKGYTVPRCGTVQATLLNPMGTVVRMFVIPYDMRDMPTLHQTFIRQRILADTVVQTENAYNQNGVEKEFNDDVQQDRATTTVNMKTKHQMQQQLQPEREDRQPTIQQQRSPQCNNENKLGHFISTENMKSLRYSIHLRFQTSRTGRLMLHTDIRLLISRRTDCDTAAAHAKGVLEAPNELITNTVMPTNPKYSARQDQTTSKI